MYQNNLSFTDSGWQVITLSTPFDYNGTDNLMLDISFDNSFSYGSYMWTTLTSTGVSNRSVYYASDSFDGDPLQWEGDMNPWPNFRPDIPHTNNSQCFP